MSEQDAVELSARYARFAEEEARGRSSLYETLAQGVAEDRTAIGFLMTLPKEKQQPNLLFAAIRHLFGIPKDWPDFRRTLLAHSNMVRSVMLLRSTQTNEPARCAVLLPLLTHLPQPLALIEVGASAGLCLIPDLYGYNYGRGSIYPAKPQLNYPVFNCSLNQAAPIPTAMPQIIWRAGLDINPIDAADPSQCTWLETLVWPEQEDRLANLRAGLRIAAAQKLRLIKGDLIGNDLERLCQEAPADATLVIFHTAVLTYIANQAERDAFAARAMSLCQHWISNESPRVFPEISNRTRKAPAPGRFLLSDNGVPIAWTDPQGVALEWIDG
ncbi:hypothetical protein ATN84_19620 [Paramesorhizobium deserti]|uniref:DUF2332 domain-containing protein n=1 Tax=Paramesorhizobium deserti TaxID=1494590 RepID=A0A135HQK4_9HYPH|nr:DUF2332 domain-containing protein [Paramesorhizobium deserti]KXF75469.1 hypothetical protein ATN84_19620 [Paramesorhizobium deserti]